MKGRKPKLTVIQGDGTPEDCPPPAPWLSEAEKHEWRRVAPTLQERNLLGPDTIATLEAYCIAVGVVRETYQPPKPGAQGTLFADTSDNEPSPAKMKTMFAAIRESRLLAAELGLTPHRRGMKGDDGEKKNGGWDADLLA